MVTKAWKVYGRDGHRQRESFFDSARYDFSDGEDIRIIELINADMTGTNDYSIICITRNTAQECYDELEGQLSDGAFENSAYGEVVEIQKEEGMDTMMILKKAEENVQTMDEMFRDEDSNMLLMCIGMTIDYWAARHDEDPAELIRTLQEVSAGVNEAFGRAVV